MTKPLIVVQGPVATRSGYGNHTRDLVRSLIAMDKYDIIADPEKGVYVRGLILLI